MTEQIEGAPIVERIAQLRSEAEDAIAGAQSTDALEEARIRYLGRKAELPNLLRHVADLPPEQRGPTGKAANEARQALEAQIEQRAGELATEELQKRLSEDRKFRLEVGDAKSFAFDGPRSQQQVTVTLQSSSSPVNVYLVLEKDLEAARAAVLEPRRPDAPLVAQEKTQDAKLDATVPAKEGYAVLVSGASLDTDISLKIRGR